jgi:hypothetical protein
LRIWQAQKIMLQNGQGFQELGFSEF